MGNGSDKDAPDSLVGNSTESLISDVAGSLVAELVAARKLIATAESCTGGWIAKSITDVPGSSGCFGYGIVSYSDAAKEALLDVKPSLIRDYGAVSEETVRGMAQGARRLSGADIAVAVSGIAGPGGGTVDKPAGTVWIGWAWRAGDDAQVEASLYRLAGDRDAVRRQSVLLALQGALERVSRVE